MSCKECEQRREWIRKNILEPIRKTPTWVEQAFRAKAEQKNNPNPPDTSVTIS